MKRFFVLILCLTMIGCGNSDAYQATVTVPNGTGAQVRTNMNNAFRAVSTGQSGATAPAPTFAHQFWYDISTTPPTMRIRNAGNTAWDVYMPRFRGALVWDTSGGDQLTFASELYDTDNIHSTTSNTDLLVVPAGVSRIRLSAQVVRTTAGQTLIEKNGSHADFAGAGNAIVTVTGSNPVIQLITAVIPVVPGDYFRIYNTGDVPADATGATWFAMEIIQ